MIIRKPKSTAIRCDSCRKIATTTLVFNSCGDKIFMCETHTKALKEELDKFVLKSIGSTESTQAKPEAEGE